MKTLLEKASVLRFHRERLTSYPDFPEKWVGWRDAEVQQRRFDALLRVGTLDGKAVLDLGCGTGVLKRLLDLRYRGFSYVGVDQQAEFIELARRDFGQRPECYFCVADAAIEALPTVDVVIASGLLSYRTASEGYLLYMIQRMVAAARESVAVNFLDASTMAADGLLVGYSKEEILSLCKTLVPVVEIHDDYLPGDFTVILRKSAGKGN